MSKVFFKKIFFSSVIFTVFISASIMLEYFKINLINNIELELPLLIIASLTLFSLVNFLVYPRAKTFQVIGVTFLNLLIFLISLTFVYLSINFLGVKEYGINENFAVALNPLVTFLLFLACISGLF